MTIEDAGELDPSSDSAEAIDALEYEVQLLHEIRDGLASHPGSDVMVEATTRVIEERQAQLERSRHPSWSGSRSNSSRSSPPRRF